MKDCSAGTQPRIQARSPAGCWRTGGWWLCSIPGPCSAAGLSHTAPVLLGTQEHQAGEVTLGRNKFRGKPDKCCISPARGGPNPPSWCRSTTASVLGEGNPQAEGDKREGADLPWALS